MNRAMALCLGLIFLVASLFNSGCRGSGSSQTTEGQPTEPRPTQTPGPTSTALPPPLPEVIALTLQPHTGHLDRRTYLADALTGEIFEIGADVGLFSWVSATQLVLRGEGLFLFDLEARTLQRIQGSVGDRSISFSHSSNLMTWTDAEGNLMITGLTDGHVLAHLPVGSSSTEEAPWVLWSPDDRHIFYRFPDVESSFISSVGPDPVTLTVVTNGCTGSCAAWAPDGQAIVFANSDGIFSVDADSGAEAPLYAWPANSQMAPHDLKLSSDGRYALLAVGGTWPGNYETLVVPLSSGGNGILITGVDPYEAQWWPNNDILAIVTNWCKSDASLVLLTPDGRIYAKIVTQNGLDVPYFSEDGSLISCVSSEPGKEEESDSLGTVVRTTADGYDVLSFIPDFTDADWQPGGHWLAYTRLLARQCPPDLPETQILPFP